MKRKRICIAILLSVTVLFSNSCVANRNKIEIENSKQDQEQQISDEKELEQIENFLSDFISVYGFTARFNEQNKISVTQALRFFSAKEAGNKEYYIKPDYREYLASDSHTLIIPKFIVRDYLDRIFNVDYSTDDPTTSNYTIKRNASDISNTKCEVTSTYIAGNIISVKYEIKTITPISYDASGVLITIKNYVGYGEAKLIKTNNELKIISCESSPIDVNFDEQNYSDDESDIIVERGTELYKTILYYFSTVPQSFDFNAGDVVPVDALLGYFCTFELGNVDELIKEEYEQYLIPGSLSVLIPSEEVVRILEKKFKVSVNIDDSVYITNNKESFLLARNTSDISIDFNITDCMSEGDIRIVKIRFRKRNQKNDIDVLIKELMLETSENNYAYYSCNTIQ